MTAELVLRGEFDVLHPLAVRVHQHAMRGVPTEALRMADQAKVDFALINIELPGPNGIDAARELRRRHRDLPLVLMSLHESEVLRLARTTLATSCGLTTRAISNPAARALATPESESSTTRGRRTPRRCAANRYGSGAGLCSATSSPKTAAAK